MKLSEAILWLMLSVKTVSGNNLRQASIDEPRKLTVPTCEFSTENLICNGSFELNVVDPGTKKEFADYLVPGWTSSTGTVCLSNYAYGVPAYEGKNYAELDCIAGGPVEGLYQMVPTLEDQEYALSFKMRARDPYPNTEDEGVNVEWNGYKVQPTSYLAPSGDWELKQVIVKGTGGPVKLLFRESLSKGASDGSGPYIDDVVLKPIAITPPPPTPEATPNPTPYPTPYPTEATPNPTPYPTPYPTEATPNPTPYPTAPPTPPPTVSCRLLPFTSLEVVSVSLDDQEDLSTVLDLFTSILGGLNNGNGAASDENGHRRINWDGAAVPFDMPGDFFAVGNLDRGLTISKEEKLAVSNPPPGEVDDNLFDSINPHASVSFKTFSPPRLFSPVMNNVIELTFTEPGNGRDATISGFGAYFVDVEDPVATKISLINILGCEVASRSVEPNPGGVSFLGLKTNRKSIKKVIITLGTATLVDNKTGGDIVVLDDFLYDEPRAGVLLAV